MSKLSAGMSVQMKGPRLILFVIGLFLVNIMIMSDFVIMPIVDALYTEFPNGTNTVNFIVSGASLIIIFGSILTPVVLKKVPKKTLLVVLSILFCFASIFGAAIDSLPYIVACRVVVGFCAAAGSVIAMGTIAEVWVDETRRATVMGFFNAAMAGLAGLMGLLSGVLAESTGDWHTSFNTYWLAIPMLILVVLFFPRLPRVEAAPASEGQAGKTSGAKSGLGVRYYHMIVAFLLTCIGYNSIFLFLVSVFVSEAGLGGATYAGTLTTVNMVGTATMCALFGFVYKKLKIATAVPFYIGMFAMMCCMLFVRNPFAITVVCLLAGGCWGCIFSYVFAEASLSVPVHQVDMAMGLTNGLMNICAFGCTFLSTALMDALGTGLVGIIPVYLCFAAIAIASEIVRVLRYRKRATAADGSVMYEQQATRNA